MTEPEQTAHPILNADGSWGMNVRDFVELLRKMRDLNVSDEEPDAEMGGTSNEVPVQPYFF